jgi:hypothetical protein
MSPLKVTRATPSVPVAAETALSNPPPERIVKFIVLPATGLPKRLLTLAAMLEVLTPSAAIVLGSAARSSWKAETP